MYRWFPVVRLEHSCMLALKQLPEVLPSSAVQLPVSVFVILDVLHSDLWKIWYIFRWFMIKSKLIYLESKLYIRKGSLMKGCVMHGTFSPMTVEMFRNSRNPTADYYWAIFSTVQCSGSKSLHLFFSSANSPSKLAHFHLDVSATWW